MCDSRSLHTRTNAATGLSLAWRNDIGARLQTNTALRVAGRLRGARNKSRRSISGASFSGTRRDLQALISTSFRRVSPWSRNVRRFCARCDRPAIITDAFTQNRLSPAILRHVLAEEPSDACVGVAVTPPPTLSPLITTTPDSISSHIRPPPMGRHLLPLRFRWVQGGREAEILSSTRSQG
jgi:hypothetical protein